MTILEETDYWQSVASDWKKTRPDRLWRKHSDAVNQSLLSRWLPEQPVPRLLKTDTFDEAVGTGLTRFLRARTRSLVGMDLSVKNVRFACHDGSGVRGACADVRDLPFGDASFDVVLSNSTLDHFQTSEEITTSLRELYRVLREGGQLIVTMDNLMNPVIAIRNRLPFTLLNRLGILPYYVGITWGPRRLRTKLQEVGFDVTEVTAVLHCPRMLAVPIARLFCSRTALPAQRAFLRWLQKFEGLGRWTTRYVTGHFIAVRAEKPRSRPQEARHDP